MQNRPNSGYPKVHFQVAMTVPFDDSDLAALFDPKIPESRGKLEYTMVHILVSVAHLIPVNDFLVRRPGDAVFLQMLQYKLAIIRGYGNSSFKLAPVISFLFFEDPNLENQN